MNFEKSSEYQRGQSWNYNLHLQMHVTECREFLIGYADELNRLLGTKIRQFLLFLTGSVILQDNTQQLSCSLLLNVKENYTQCVKS